MVQNSYFNILPQLVVYSLLMDIRPARGSEEQDLQPLSP